MSITRRDRLEVVKKALEVFSEATNDSVVQAMEHYEEDIRDSALELYIALTEILDKDKGSFVEVSPDVMKMTDGFFRSLTAIYDNEKFIEDSRYDEGTTEKDRHQALLGVMLPLFRAMGPTVEKFRDTGWELG